MNTESTAGLIEKFKVERLTPSSRGVDHTGCRYFVLDPLHDPIAREALRDYAVHALSYGYLNLYQDLDRWLTSLPPVSSGVDQ